MKISSYTKTIIISFACLVLFNITLNATVPIEHVGFLAISDNFIYLCEDNRLIVKKLNGEVIKVYYSGKDFPAFARLTSVCKYKNEIYVGTYGAGIIHLRKNGKIENFNITNSGLINNFITSLTVFKILQKEMLVAGTRKGVAIFDGKIFTALTIHDGLPDNNITHVANSKEGLIISTTNKAAIYHNNTIKIVKELPVKLVNCGAYFNKKFYFGTEQGLFEYTGEKIYYYNKKITPLKDNGILCLKPYGKFLYIGTRTGIYRYSGQTWVKYNQDLPCYSLSIKDNMLFAACGNYGLKTYSVQTPQSLFKKIIETREKVKKGIWSHFNKSNGLFGSLINDIYIEKDFFKNKSKIYVATNNGLFIYRNKKFERLYGIKGNVTSVILLKSKFVFQKEIVCSIFGKGILCIKSTNNRKLLTYKDGLPSLHIYCLENYKSGFVAGTSAGLFVFDGKRVRIYTKRKNGLISDEISCITVLNDKIFIGTPFGLSVLANGKIKNYTMWDGLPDIRISCMTKYSKNKIAIGTYYGGFSIFSANDFPHFENHKSVNGVRKIRALYGLNEKLYIGTDKGVIFYAHRRYKNLIDKQGPYNVTALCAAKDILCAGTDGGEFSILKLK